MGSGVGRRVLVAALAGSSALGLLTGALLHSTVADRDAIAAVPATPSPVGPPRSSETGQTKPRRVSPAPGPEFTVLALLQPAELVKYGWVSARLIQSYEELPSPPITPCGTPGQPAGLYRTYAAVYASARTTAAEVAIRFDTEEHAEAAFAAMRAAAESCETAASASERRSVGAKRTVPAASRVDEALWWRTHDLADGTDHGVLGIGRSGDRVLVVHLESDLPGSDPAKTTDIDGLLIQATRRLV